MNNFHPESFSESNLINFPIHFACKNGDVEKVKALLQMNFQLAVSEDHFHHWTPSHWAASFGQLDCLKQVAMIFPNMINIQSSKTFATPLHCAAESGHIYCVLWLLHAGANPNVKDILGETALHKASRTGNLDCVTFLISASSNIGTLNNIGQTASTLAEINGHYAIVDYIRKHESLVELNNSSLNNFNPNMHYPRKRTWDMMNNNSNKRMRFETLEENSLSTMTSSIVEHEKLCFIEHHYSRSLLKRMFHEYHGY